MSLAERMQVPTQPYVYDLRLLGSLHASHKAVHYQSRPNIFHWMYRLIFTSSKDDEVSTGTCHFACDVALPAVVSVSVFIYWLAYLLRARSWCRYLHVD